MNGILRAGFVAGLALIGAASLAMAQPGEGRGGRGLGLSQEQKAQLKSLRQGQKEACAAPREQLKALRVEMRQELSKEAPDLAKLDRLIDDAGKAGSDLKKARLRHAMEVKKVLTPQQWQKVRHRLLAGAAGGRGREGAQDRPGRGRHRGGRDRGW